MNGDAGFELATSQGGTGRDMTDGPPGWRHAASPTLASGVRIRARSLLAATLATVVSVSLLASLAISAVPDASDEPTVALPGFGASAQDEAVGEVAPEVSGLSSDGTPTAIPSDGRPKMLLFLADPCLYCARQIPEVLRWLDEEHPPDPVDLVTVATFIDQLLTTDPSTEGAEWTAPVIIDSDGQVADRYGMSAFPAWVLIGADGRVAWSGVGALSTEQLDQAAGLLLSSEPPAH